MIRCVRLKRPLRWINGKLFQKTNVSFFTRFFVTFARGQANLSKILGAATLAKFVRQFCFRKAECLNFEIERCRWKVEKLQNAKTHHSVVTGKSFRTLLIYYEINLKWLYCWELPMFAFWRFLKQVKKFAFWSWKTSSGKVTLRRVLQSLYFAQNLDHYL